VLYAARTVGGRAVHLSDSSEACASHRSSRLVSSLSTACCFDRRRCVNIGFCFRENPIVQRNDLIESHQGRCFLYGCSIDDPVGRPRSSLVHRSLARLRFNQGHLTRIYPGLCRKSWKSSNFEPNSFWSAACQLVALNFQMPGLVASRCFSLTFDLVDLCRSSHAYQCRSIRCQRRVRSSRCSIALDRRRSVLIEDAAMCSCPTVYVRFTRP
jgi:hypothetical protein